MSKLRFVGFSRSPMVSCRRMLVVLPAALALTGAGAGVAAAAAPSPCSPAGTTNGKAKFNCQFYTPGNGISGGSPVYASNGSRVGYLRQGTNYVLCQRTGATVTVGAYFNNNWAFTQADNLSYGWVNAVYASGGGNNGGFGGVPGCSASTGNPPGAVPQGGLVPEPPAPAVDGRYRRTKCKSAWMTQVSAEGVGKGFVTSVWPTWNARFRANSADQWRPMWEDVKRCLKFSSNQNFALTSTQISSLKKQLACHAKYGKHAIFGGNTWDLEAKRPDIPWDQALSFRNRCGWT